MHIFRPTALFVLPAAIGGLVALMMCSISVSRQDLGKNFYSSVDLFDLESGKAKRIYKSEIGDYAYVNAVTFSPDGKRLFTTRGSTIDVWNAPDFKEMSIFSKLASIVHCVMVLRDGNTMITDGENHKLFIWDLRTKKKRVVPFERPYPSSFAVTSDQKTIALGSGVAWDKPGFVDLIDLKSGNKVQRFDYETIASHVAFHPTRSLLAIAGGVGQTAIWDWESKKLVKILDAHGPLAFAPSGRELACYLSKRKDVIFGNMETFETRGFFAGFQRQPNCMAYSPNGKMIALGGWSNDPYVKIFETATGKLMFTHNSHGITYALSFSPDGKSLAIGASN